MNIVKHFILLGCMFFASLAAQTEYQETFPVILEPIKQATIYTLINTRVVSLPFKLGDSFRKGDVLIQFDNKVIEATLKKTESTLQKAKEDVKVKKALEKDHLISSYDLLDSMASLANAEMDNEIAKQSMDESQLRAPFDGKVSALNIHLFEIPPHDRPVMEIINDQMLIANFLVPSRYISRAKVGVPVYIRINDTHDIVTATIKHVSPNVNAASGTIKIEAELRNPSGNIKSGMASQAAFTLDAFRETEGSIGKILEEMKKEEKQPK